MNRTAKIVGAGVAPLAAGQIAGADVQAGVTAAGSTQATATSVYGDNVSVTTVAASTGVLAFAGPTPAPGDTQFITNQGANALSVYPPVGAQINALGTNAAFSVAAGKSVLLVCFSATQFYALLSA